MKSFSHGSIHEFIPWYDTDGNIINASDGGIIYAGGKYHWYGMALRARPMASGPNGGQMTDVGVVMYASDDLLNWQYEGVILGVSDDPSSPLFAPLRFERPKIVYNDKTGQFVLWCHYVKYPGDHGTDIGTADMGLAVCDTVNGTYKWLGFTRPIDQDGLVRDMTIYKDFDGTAYAIYDRHVISVTPDGSQSDRCLYVVKLSEDYLSFTDTYTRIQAAYWREAPAIVYKNGYYHIVTSGLTGWDTNQAKAFRTKHLLDEWEDMGDPCVDDVTHTTFHTQSTYAFPVRGTDLQIMMFERHNTANFKECSYVWLPVQFNDDDTICLKYLSEWTL
jgi:hypothetical protein